MKYIKTFEEGNKIPWFEKENRDLEIGDVVICVYHAGDDELEYGQTYVVEDVRGAWAKQAKLKGLEYWWDCDRFKIKSNMDPNDVEFYDGIVLNKQAEKYNL